MSIGFDKTIGYPTCERLKQILQLVWWHAMSMKWCRVFLRSSETTLSDRGSKKWKKIDLNFRRDIQWFHFGSTFSTFCILLCESAFNEKRRWDTITWQRFINLFVLPEFFGFSNAISSSRSFHALVTFDHFLFEKTFSPNDNAPLYTPLLFARITI